MIADAAFIDSITVCLADVLKGPQDWLVFLVQVSIAVLTIFHLPFHISKLGIQILIADFRRDVFAIDAT